MSDNTTTGQPNSEEYKMCEFRVDQIVKTLATFFPYEVSEPMFHNLTGALTILQNMKQSPAKALEICVAAIAAVQLAEWIRHQNPGKIPSAAEATALLGLHTILNDVVTDLYAVPAPPKQETTPDATQN